MNRKTFIKYLGLSTIIYPIIACKKAFLPPSNLLTGSWNYPEDTGSIEFSRSLKL